MDLKSGKFAAPKDGTYAFSFTGMAVFPSSSSQVFLRVEMYLNGNEIGIRGEGNEVSTVVQDETFSFQSILNLQKGDEIWLEMADKSTGVYLKGNNYTQFSGYLLEENLSIIV